MIPAGKTQEIKTTNPNFQVKVLRYDGTTAIVEIYLAPGVVSKSVVPLLVEKFELMLAESPVNMFLQNLFE